MHTIQRPFILFLLFNPQICSLDKHLSVMIPPPPPYPPPLAPPVSFSPLCRIPARLEHLGKWGLFVALLSDALLFLYICHFPCLLFSKPNQHIIWPHITPSCTQQDTRSSSSAKLDLSVKNSDELSDFKGIVQSKMNSLSSFTHHHVSTNH